MTLNQQLAQCYNNNDFSNLGSYLDEDCKYASQWVMEELCGKDTISEYLIAKSQRIAETKSFVRAVEGIIQHPYPQKDCILLFQGDDNAPSCIIVLEEKNQKISRIDICMPELFEWTEKGTGLQKGSDDSSAGNQNLILDPNLFLKYAMRKLHHEARRLRHTNRKFIFNEYLAEAGIPFLTEGAKSRHLYSTDTEYYYSVSTANMQMGLILAHQLYMDKESIDSGLFFDYNRSLEAMNDKLQDALRDDLNITFEKWDEFRHIIIPLFSKLISDYSKRNDIAVYVNKLFYAYYLLGVSIGLERYEPE